MTDNLDIPEAFCRLVQAGDVWQWVVDRCPYCGKRHAHGGGPADGDPRELLGHRVAHCGSGAGYILVEAEV